MNPFILILFCLMGLPLIYVLFVRQALHKRRIKRDKKVIQKAIEAQLSGQLDLDSPDCVQHYLIAYSSAEPTAFGWKNQVGSMVIWPGGVLLVDTKDFIHLPAPVHAQPLQHEFAFWELIHLTLGDGGGGEIFAAVRGFPKTKFSATQSAMKAESRGIIEDIKRIQGPHRDHPLPL